MAQSKQKSVLWFFFLLWCCVYLPRALAPFYLVSSLSYPLEYDLLVGRAHPFSTSVVTPHSQDTVVIPGLAQRRAEEMHLELSNEIATIGRR